MRPSAIVLACALTLACSISTAAGFAQSKPLPDVVLVTIDTLRADHVGCYGDKQASTPTLDSLCAAGVRFTQAYSAATITNTSHASIMTGLYPSRHGVTDFGIPLAKQRTLAQELKQAGYSTAAFIGSVILDNRTLALGLGNGFDHYDDFPAGNTGGPRWERVERRAGEVVRRANLWLDQHPRGPRFLWVHLYDPHDPYEPPPPFAARFKGRLYDGEIAYADQALGQLLAKLRRQGRYDPSLILVMSDHGEGLGEHGEQTHGIFLYDSTTHVPLIVKLPGGARKGATVENTVSLVDVFPTVMDLLGLKPALGSIFAADSAGASFKEALLGHAPKPQEGDSETVFAETDYPLRFGWAPLKSVRDGSRKYIEAPRPEFYDLAADPGEADNRYQPWDANVQALRGKMAAFRSGAPKTTAAQAPVDPKTIAELKALGYLGADPGSTTAPEPAMLPDSKDKIEVQNLLHTAMMQEENGEIAAARHSYEQAAAADASSFFALSQLGQLEFRARDFKPAVEHLSRAYALRADAQTALALGQALVMTGDFRVARDVLEAALKQSPGNYAARVALGKSYWRLEDMAAAQDQFEAAVLLDAKAAAAHLGLARVYLRQKKLEAARAELTAAAASEPDHPELRELTERLKK